METFIGEIRLLPYTFAPAGWHDCDGSLLSIAENEPLFSLIGTTYGGDGMNTFAVPDLRGRLPIHKGTGTGLGTYALGEMAGTEAVTLTSAQMPAHSHTVMVTSAVATTGTPGGSVQPGALNGDSMYASDAAGASALQTANVMIGSNGGNQPHSNTMPTLTVRFCIALFGIWPSRS